MSNNNGSRKGGISVAGLLGVAFIVLKLCGVINWPWIWVVSPFWISLIVGLIIVVVTVMFFKD